MAALSGTGNCLCHCGGGVGKLGSDPLAWTDSGRGSGVLSSLPSGSCPSPGTDRRGPGAAGVGSGGDAYYPAADFGNRAASHRSGRPAGKSGAAGLRRMFCQERLYPTGRNNGGPAGTPPGRKLPQARTADSGAAPGTGAAAVPSGGPAAAGGIPVCPGAAVSVFIGISAQSLRSAAPAGPGKPSGISGGGVCPFPGEGTGQRRPVSGLFRAGTAVFCPAV